MKVRFLHIYKYKLSIILLALYLFCLPLDMVSQVSGFGTVLKYVAIIASLSMFFELLYYRYPVSLRADHLIVVAYVLSYSIGIFWPFYADPRMPVYINSLLTLVLFYCLVVLRSYNIEEYEFLKSATIAGILIFGGYIMIIGLDFWLYGNRFTISMLGRSADPNNVAASCVIPAVFCTERLFNRSYNLISRMVNAAVLVLILYIAMLTGSRGGLAAVVAGIMVYCISFIRGSIFRKICGAIASLAICLLFFSISQEYLPQNIKSRFELLRIMEDKGSNRFIIWDNALQIFASSDLGRMLFGYGIVNFDHVLLTKSGFLAGPHNLFIQTIIDGGFVSLCLLCIFLFTLLRRVIVKHNWAALGSLVGVLVMAMSLDSFVKKFLWTGFMFAGMNIINRRRDKDIYYHISQDGGTEGGT